MRFAKVKQTNKFVGRNILNQLPLIVADVSVWVIKVNQVNDQMILEYLANQSLAQEEFLQNF